MKPSKQGRKFEDTLVEALPNSRRIKLSGAGVVKEDVEWAGWLIQAKTTNKASYATKREDMDNLERNAAARALLPVMIVETVNGDWEARIPFKYWRALVDGD